MTTIFLCGGCPDWKDIAESSMSTWKNQLRTWWIGIISKINGILWNFLLHLFSSSSLSYRLSIPFVLIIIPRKTDTAILANIFWYLLVSLLQNLFVSLILYLQSRLHTLPMCFPCDGPWIERTSISSCGRSVPGSHGLKWHLPSHDQVVVLFGKIYK